MIQYHPHYYKEKVSSGYRCESGIAIVAWRVTRNYSQCHNMNLFRFIWFISIDGQLTLNNFLKNFKISAEKDDLLTKWFQRILSFNDFRKYTLRF